MFTWIDILTQREYFAERRREAERYRLARQVMAGRPRHRRPYYRAFAWLGQRLVAWGGRLQERYGAAPPPVLQAADRV
jgi:hypothetical protein